MAFRLVILCLALTAQSVWGYSAGAPQEVCEDLTPKHPYPAQPNPAPYNVLVNSKQVKAGESVEVKIQGVAPSDKIKGFIIQARLGNEPVGTFDVSGSSKVAQLLDCGSGKGNTVTHKKIEGDGPQVIALKWTPPAGKSGPVKFKATILLNGATFWVGVPSNELKIN